MSDQSSDIPEFVFHKLPKTEVFFVTRDQLERAKEEGRTLGNDLNVALATGPVCISLSSTWLAGTFVPIAEAFIFVIAVVSGLISVFFGIRSWHHRKKKTHTIDRILARSIDPEA